MSNELNEFVSSISIDIQNLIDKYDDSDIAVGLMKALNVVCDRKYELERNSITRGAQS